MSYLELNDSFDKRHGLGVLRPNLIEWDLIENTLHDRMEDEPDPFDNTPDPFDDERYDAWRDRVLLDSLL
ncbi:MAG: hypothetical protein Q4A71_07745 [Actinomycetaceae bacterium]|nr:hypothetical protein [Actinomycetaceae bacterium]